MTRDELVEILNNHYCQVCRDCHIIEGVERYILERERLLLEKIGKPLREWQGGVRSFDPVPSIDEALAIIEKEGGE